LVVQFGTSVQSTADFVGPNFAVAHVCVVYLGQHQKRGANVHYLQHLLPHVVVVLVGQAQLLVVIDPPVLVMMVPVALVAVHVVLSCLVLSPERYRLSEWRWAAKHELQWNLVVRFATIAHVSTDIVYFPFFAMSCPLYPLLGVPPSTLLASLHPPLIFATDRSRGDFAASL
jgi:hypothetical protein